MANWIKTKDRVPEKQSSDHLVNWDKMAVVVKNASESPDELPYKCIQLAYYSHHLGRWIDANYHKVIDATPDIVVTHWIRCKDLMDDAT